MLNQIEQSGNNMFHVVLPLVVISNDTKCLLKSGTVSFTSMTASDCHT